MLTHQLDMVRNTVIKYNNNYQYPEQVYIYIYLYTDMGAQI